MLPSVGSRQKYLTRVCALPNAAEAFDFRQRRKFLRCVTAKEEIKRNRLTSNSGKTSISETFFDAVWLQKICRERSFYNSANSGNILQTLPFGREHPPSATRGARTPTPGTTGTRPCPGGTRRRSGTRSSACTSTCGALPDRRTSS